MIKRFLPTMSPRKQRLFRRFSIVPLGVLVLGMFYPFSFAIEKFVVGDSFSHDRCVTTPDPYPVTIVLVLLLVIWLTCAASIFIKPVRNAIYVRLVMWAGGALILLFFPEIALYMVACEDLAPVTTVALYAIPISILMSIIPMRLMKSRYEKIIDMNSHVFDFKRMRWSITSPLRHVSGEATTGKIAAWTIGAGFVGIALAKIPVGDWLGLSEFWRDWGLIAVIWLVGWLCICVYGGGDLYITWLVWRRSRLEGRPMLTAELVEDDAPQSRVRRKARRGVDDGQRE